MLVFIMGGSGRTGKLVIDECLTRGHQVTALVRNKSSLTARKNLTIVEGSPLNKADIERAFKESPELPSVAIVTLALLRESDSPFAAVTSPTGLLVDSNRNLSAVMKQFGTKKVVILEAAGTADSWSNMPYMMRFLMSHSNMKYGYKEHDQVDEDIRKTGLNFVFARPTRLVEEAAQPLKYYGDNGKGLGLMAKISRSSVALFLVDAAEKPDWDGQTPVLSN